MQGVLADYLSLLDQSVTVLRENSYQSVVAVLAQLQNSKEVIAAGLS